MSDAAENRRELLRRGALASGAVLAAGALRPTLAGAQASSDDDLRDFLVEAIGLEQVTVLAYAGAADAAEAPDDRKQLEDFRDQEQAHANALRSAIDELGFDPPEAPDSPTDTGVFDGVEGLDAEVADRLKERLDEIDSAKTPTEFPDVLLSLEDEQLDFYVGQGPALDSADLATTAAEIAGCQGQHLVVLNVQEGATPAQAAGGVAKAAAQAAPTESA
jgi:rubrerythrin